VNRFKLVGWAADIFLKVGRLKSLQNKRFLEKRHPQNL